MQHFAKLWHLLHMDICQLVRAVKVPQVAGSHCVKVAEALSIVQHQQLMQKYYKHLKKEVRLLGQSRVHWDPDV